MNIYINIYARAYIYINRCACVCVSLQNMKNLRASCSGEDFTCDDKECTCPSRFSPNSSKRKPSPRAASQATRASSKTGRSDGSMWTDASRGPNPGPTRWRTHRGMSPRKPGCPAAGSCGCAFRNQSNLGKSPGRTEAHSFCQQTCLRVPAKVDFGTARRTET